MDSVETLTDQLREVGIPADAVEPDPRWRNGVWIDNTGPLAVDGDDVLGEDDHGNTLRYRDVETAAVQLAVQYWLGARVSADRARTLLPLYRLARAWHPDDGAYRWWRLAVEGDWLGPVLGRADIVAALPKTDAGEGARPDNPVSIMLEAADTAVVVHVTGWAPQDNGWPAPVLIPSLGRRIEMDGLLAIARNTESREAMTAAVQQEVKAVVERTRKHALSTLRDRWHEREQWTLSEAAEHCGVTPATVRSYRERLGFPRPLPYWAVNRDAGRQSVVDAEQVRSWHALRPGQGARTDRRADS
ncbi:hypothetical protein [Amycolatopsis sp. WGS_07]|uniref:hypothetical protein n=1 Tax=Amycolatopsis sp. WGS_07 TaxID=3076764 RepID=UPI003873A0D4